MHILVITKFITEDLKTSWECPCLHSSLHYSYFLVLIKRAVYIIRQSKFRKPSNKT